MRKRHRSIKDIMYFFALLVLTLVFLISGLQVLESTVFNQAQNPEQQAQRKTIVVDGVEYFPRQDITVMLIMGIDQSGPAQDSGYYRNPGAADVVMLLIFDEKNEDITVLYLNRDTMMQIPVLGLGGKEAGHIHGQLALAHTYGNGLEDSCENTAKAVSEFLNNISIDYYLSMRMDAIALLNDAVGGVTVQVADDFSGIDPDIPMGEVTLRGEQAMRYVRTRKGVGDQLNITRIERQKEYIRGFSEAFETAVDGDSAFVVTTYDAVSPYLVTDCSVNTISGMLTRYEGYEIREIITPEGENAQGEEYYEFYADRDKLDRLILRLFYAPK